MKIINNDIKLSKLKISNESINLLIERAMGDRNNLKNEINKLKSLALNKNVISYEQIKELMDAAEQKEVDEAMSDDEDDDDDEDD